MLTRDFCIAQDSQRKKRLPPLYSQSSDARDGRSSIRRRLHRHLRAIRISISRLRRPYRHPSDGSMACFQPGISYFRAACFHGSAALLYGLSTPLLCGVVWMNVLLVV